MGFFFFTKNSGLEAGGGCLLLSRSPSGCRSPLSSALTPLPALWGGLPLPQSWGHLDRQQASLLLQCQSNNVMLGVPRELPVALFMNLVFG